jgi:two-component system OmpR family response regulator
MTTRKCRSILYVDDDPDVCIVVQFALCRIAGMDVTTADSGEKAIDLAYELRPDLIVLDVMMPGLDGPATYQRIRESPLISDIPVIFMTAKVLPSEVARFLGLGAIGVVGKPFDPLRIGDELAAIWTDAYVALEGSVRRDGEAAVLEKIDTLAEQFLARTRADVGRLRSLVRSVRLDGHAEFKEIEHLAHSIHGAGAMLGFSAVSKSGGAIEHFVESLLMCVESKRKAAEPTPLPRLHKLVEDLARDVEAAHVIVPSKQAMFSDIGAVQRKAVALHTVAPRRGGL